MKGKLKYIMCFLVGALIFSISAVFAYPYLAQNVGFTPSETTWNVDNTKDALDDLYFHVGDHKDFTLSIDEVNGTYVAVSVPSNYSNNSYTYTWYLGKIPVETTTDSSYIFKDLSPDTTYRLHVVIDTGSTKYYSYDYIRTLKVQMLYKEGYEYPYLTGGWIAETVPENSCAYARGLSEKNSKYMLLYYSQNGCSMSRLRTTKSIYSGGFSKLYVKYYKYPNLGNMKYIVINGVSSTYTASDWILEYISFSNKNEPVSIHNWDSYDYFFEIYLSN